MADTGLNREAVLTAALDLIDRRGGVREVSLRSVARELGCAHTNLYNYVSDADQLYWQARTHCLATMVTTVDRQIERVPGPGARLEALLEGIVAFYLRHPGWFRLVWLEDLGPQAPDDATAAALGIPALALGAAVGSAAPHLTQDEADHVADILTMYLQGALSRWLTGRSDALLDHAAAHHAITSDLHLLFRALSTKEIFR